MRKCMIALCVLFLFAFGCGSEPAQPPPGSSADTPAGSSAEQENAEPPSEQEDAEPSTDATAEPPAEQENAEQSADTTAETIQATITMEDGGEIVLELYHSLAPQSVRNFVYLARQGYYDGLKFHRIMQGFMIQGGCPDGTGGGGPGYNIRGEFQINGFVNELSHTRGVISMARQQDPFFDSAGSQFFIVHQDSTGLDNSYAAFGRVIDGMDVVDVLAQTPNSGPNGAVAEADMPIIRSITIDSDADLPPPDKL